MNRLQTILTLSIAIICVGFSLNAPAQKLIDSSATSFTGKRSDIKYIVNKGQVHNGEELLPKVIGIGVSSESRLILSNAGYSHQVCAPAVGCSIMRTHPDGSSDRLIESLQFHRIDMKWIGAAQNTEIEWSNPSREHTHYYNLPGNRPPVTNVPSYNTARLEGIYPGIDVKFYSNGSQFEYDYEIAPFADHSVIKIEIDGGKTSVNSSGELIIDYPGGKIIESAPKVFQLGRELKSNWIQLDQNIWGFEVQGRNEEYAMVIDPLVRVWGTYNGGSNGDEINDIDTDDEGFIYAVGGAESPNNIATTGAHQQSVDWGKDALITKLHADGNRLWGTYLGGNGNESAWSVDIKGDGILYFVGRTESTNNIATAGAHQTLHGDGGNVFDGFVQRFTADGQRIWGTYYGGEDYDRGRFCNIAADGNLYVAGVTKSFNNISTPGSHQEAYMGLGNPEEDDAMLIKFDPNGNRIWATYYGGSEWEEGLSCITDDSDHVFLFGHAQSTTNISTAGSFQPVHAGGTWDSFMVKFDGSGIRQWGTYIGGNDQDLSWSMTMDEAENLYITGRTQSLNDIATPGAYQENNGGSFDAYLMKFSSDGNKIWGSYFGGNQYERGYACRMTSDGNILLSGHTESNNSISTLEVHQEDYGGNTDAFLSKFDTDGSLLWSTYYGGNSEDVGRGCASFSNFYYLAGFTESNASIATMGIHQEVYGGSQDGFVAKFVECDISNNELEVTTCEDYTAPDGEVYDESGEYTATLQGQWGCDSIVTINLTISDQIITNQYHVICDGESITLPDGTTTSEEGTIINEYISFQGCDSIVNHHIAIAPGFELDIDTTICDNEILIDPEGNEIDEAGEYSFTYSSINGCDSVVHLDLNFIPTSSTSHSTTICQGDHFLGPNGDEVYSAGIYDYTLESSNGCDSVVTYEINVVPSPIAHFTTDPSGGSDVFETNIQFYNESIGADHVLWDFFEYGNSSQPHPVIEFADSAGVHPVCLYAFTEEGCADSVCVDYGIAEEFTIYIPNAFTPNGDGINDLFFVEGHGIDPDHFLIQVFNRWGELIYESRDHLEKWNGEGPRGTHYVQNEVYVYKVLVGALHSTEVLDFTGRVTVIR